MLRFSFAHLLPRAAMCCLCTALGTGSAPADEGDDVARAVLVHIRERLPASAPLTPADEDRVTTFMHYILGRFYYPTNAHDLITAANSSVDSVETPVNASALVEAAVTAAVGALGHGARLLTTIGGGELAGTAATTRNLGSTRVVSLPSMSVSAGATHTCADFIRNIDGGSTDGITGFVLDLRGNEGGPLTDSSCLASLFLKKGQALFQVVSKQGSPVKYESEATGQSPISVPVVVLIDKRTDNGGLLVAAILQDHGRATVIGEQKDNINGAVSTLLFPTGTNRAIVLPTGEIRLADKHPLAAGVRVDISVPAQDENALLSAAQSSLAQQH